MVPRIVLGFCAEIATTDYTFAYVMAAGHEGRLLKADFSMFPPQGSIYVPRLPVPAPPRALPRSRLLGRRRGPQLQRAQSRRQVPRLPPPPRRAGRTAPHRLPFPPPRRGAAIPPGAGPGIVLSAGRPRPAAGVRRRRHGGAGAPGAGRGRRPLPLRPGAAGRAARRLAQPQRPPAGPRQHGPDHPLVRLAPAAARLLHRPRLHAAGPRKPPAPGREPGTLRRSDRPARLGRSRRSHPAAAPPPTANSARRGAADRQTTGRMRAAAARRPQGAGGHRAVQAPDRRGAPPGAGKAEDAAR